MMTTVAELLNSIRSDAIRKAGGGNRQLLTVADILEETFAIQDQALTTTHGYLVQAQREKQDTEEKLRIALEKLALAEESLRIEAARRYGRSSEKWTIDEHLQALLFNEAEFILTTIATITESKTEASRIAETNDNIVSENTENTKQRGKRERLPDYLPRQEKRLEVSEQERTCADCGQPMIEIGQEVSEQLQMKPIEFYVERTIRPTYACSCGCGGVATAPVEPSVYPKSILGDGVIAQIITNKFCDGLPFYRQERILSRSGIEVSRQTMARAAGAVAEAFTPLISRMNELLMQNDVLCADETRLRVLHEHGLKKEGHSYMWVTAGHAQGLNIVNFHYGGRDATVAQELLTGFSGVLMCDGYSAYPSAVKGQSITLAACMAHVRRKFHDVVKADRKNVRAQEALTLIKALYEIEREAADLTGAARLELRQTKAVPIFANFRTWLYQQSAAVMPKSALGKAITYAVDLLPRLEVYLSHGNVPIDNNRAENAIRPFVVGRKNWLFNDQADGAKASAILYSLIESAKANGLEPLHYLRFLLKCYRIFGPHAMPWDELLPWPDLRTRAESLGVAWDLI